MRFLKKKIVFLRHGFSSISLPTWRMATPASWFARVTTWLFLPTENLYDEPSADLSEIDARLQALQEYMNKLETRT